MSKTWGRVNDFQPELKKIDFDFLKFSIFKIEYAQKTSVFRHAHAKKRHILLSENPKNRKSEKQLRKCRDVSANFDRKSQNQLFGSFCVEKMQFPIFTRSKKSRFLKQKFENRKIQKTTSKT